MQQVSPVCICKIELSTPLNPLRPPDNPPGASPSQARALICLYGEPLGWVEFALEAGEVGPDELAVGIWQTLGAEINRRLAANAFPPVETLTPDGLPAPDTPERLRAYARLETPPFVSVVVPTHDRPDALEVGLDALLNLTYPNYEVIVVDNAPSTSASANLFEAKYAGYEHLHYILEPFPNASLARNRGLAQAKGEIVAFTDDDAIVDTEWLTNIVTAFAAAPRTACVTGLIVPTTLETETQIFFQGLWEHGGFMRGFERRVFDLGENRPDDPLYPYRATIFGSGGSMAFKAGALRAVGGFDPKLGPGSPTLAAEELDAFFRIVLKGHQLVYEPSAMVSHPNPRTYENLYRHVYGFGVGLTAFITKCVLTNPVHLLRLLVKVPYGLRFAFSPSSSRNRRQVQSEYTRKMAQADFKGLLYGPIAYLRSLWYWFNAKKKIQ